MYYKNMSATNNSPHYYLARKRIERAKELLRGNSNEYIYSVAEQVGMGNNPQYFSQMFKRMTGKTPSEYISG